MSILKGSILKLSSIFMMVGMMAMGLFTMNITAAVAATPCGTTVTISGGTTPSTPNCDIAVTVSPNVSVSGLSFTSVSDVTVQPVVVGSNAFTFAASVTDVRDTNEGWQLQAASAGLSTTNHSSIFLPLSIGLAGSTADCTLTTGTLVTNTDCPIPVVTPITVTSTPQTFVTETPSGAGNVNPISGVSALSVAGSYTIPVGTYPGAYTGAITLSLLNTFA